MPTPGERARRPTSVARQVLVLQVVVVLLLVAAAVGLAVLDARRDTRTAATERALAVASTLADSPTLTSALRRPDPSRRIEPLAERVRADAGVDFVTVMSMDRIRYSHPDPANIGLPFQGDVGTAPDGVPFTQQYAGTLGPSMRAVVPVFAGPDASTDAGAGTRRVVAMVAVGITLDRIDDQLRRDLLTIALAAAAVLLLGFGGTWLVVRRLRRQTRDLAPDELARLYEFYAAVLHAVREGVLLLDTHGRVQLVNDEARRLLALPDDDTLLGREVEGLEPGLPPAVAEAAAGRTVTDELYLAGDRMLLVSAAPADWDGRRVGSVVTLRDHTELREVTGELDVVRRLTESLRAAHHESANRLHAVVSLVELGRPEEAVDFVTEELQVAQVLTDQLVAAVDDPVVAALLLGKTAEAAERGVELRLDGSLPGAPGADWPARDLVTVLGNLIDNALDALDPPDEPTPPDGSGPSGLLAGDRRVRVDLAPGSIRVGDSGPGLGPDDAARVTARGWTSKVSREPGGRGLGLALVEQVARRHGGRLDVGHSDLGGAAFTVRWPAEPAGPASDAVPDTATEHVPQLAPDRR